MQDCRITDIDEANAEIERRRKIGLTIDPAIAETSCWHEDFNDPYDDNDEEFHEGQIDHMYFARNPGGEWVRWLDLPKATVAVLWPGEERDL
jgi:hypothetical protein